MTVWQVGRVWQVALGAVVAVVLLIATTAFAQSTPTLDGELRGQFERRLESIAASADGVVGYVVIDVDTGDRFARLDATPFPTASTIKLAILYELLKQAEEGKVPLDAVTPMDRSRAVPGGLLYELTSPSLSPRDLAVAMILQSDNTATNVLIDRLGMAAVNQRMAGLGLSNTRLRRHMIDLEAARRGDENVSTPADLARLVLVFHNGEGLTPARRPRRSRSCRSSSGRRSAAACPRASSSPARAASWKACAPTPASSICRPAVRVRRDGDLPARRRAVGRARVARRASYDYFSRRATASAYGRQIK